MIAKCANFQHFFLRRKPLTRIAISAVGLAGLENSPGVSPSRGHTASLLSDEDDENEQISLLGEDEPTPGFECIDRIMLRVRKRVATLPQRQKLALGFYSSRRRRSFC